MTALTPEQLRALADEAWNTADGLVDTDPIALRELAYRQANVLRAAADQLEAVRALHFRDPKPFASLADITCQECDQFWPCDTYIALAADTAPQEDR